MGYGELKERVWKANMDLNQAGLVVFTWGNVSGADRSQAVFAIKPSGVSYESLKPDDIVVLDIETGAVIEGAMNPSSDTPTHLVLYREFGDIGGIVHTHSIHATSWAQACREIPCLGTTHADYFSGPVPLTRILSPKEIEDAYEENTGLVIVEHFRGHSLHPLRAPGVLLPHHGPFAMGKTPEKAFENAVVLEQLARMASETMAINSKARPAPRSLIDKHYNRKHGPDAYYGQNDDPAEDD